MFSKHPSTIEFENVWGGNTQVRQEVKDFWLKLRALAGDNELENRSKQILYVARYDGKIVAVTTSVEKRIERFNNNAFFVFRVLIDPQFRIPGLVDKLMVLSRDYLEAMFMAKKSDCVGLITLVENENVKKHRREVIWPSSKFMYMGKSAQGHHIRVYYFKGARI